MPLQYLLANRQELSVFIFLLFLYFKTTSSASFLMYSMLLSGKIKFLVHQLHISKIKTGICKTPDWKWKQDSFDNVLQKFKQIMYCITNYIDC